MWKPEFISECSSVSFSTYTVGVSHWIWRSHWTAELVSIKPSWPPHLSPQSWDYRCMLLHSAFTMGIGNWTWILKLPWQALCWAISPDQPWDSDMTFFCHVHKLMACRELESIVLFNGFSCGHRMAYGQWSPPWCFLAADHKHVSPLSCSFCPPACGSSF